MVKTSEKDLVMEKAQTNESTPGERLNKITEIIDDENVNAMHTLFQNLEEENSTTYTNELVADLDQIMMPI